MVKHTLFLASSVFLLTACTPKVEVAAPEKPITINLNVKIEHEIKIKVEKELDNLFDEKSDIF
ncbi:YnbE family lipoprotein [Alkalimarinus coralli]|uniref:YnbE family lipoprotein n=1 Tax=Alkalimarinus coralli TaxID=2935863 RepID=UPI0035161726